MLNSKCYMKNKISQAISPLKSFFIYYKENQDNFLKNTNYNSNTKSYMHIAGFIQTCKEKILGV